MKSTFVLKDLSIALPEIETTIEIGELSMSIENVNVLELAKASKEIAFSYLEIIKEIQSDSFDIPFDHINSGNEQLFNDGMVPASYSGFTEGDEVVIDEMHDGIILRLNPDDDSALVKAFSPEVEIINVYLENLKHKSIHEAEKALRGENL